MMSKRSIISFCLVFTWLMVPFLAPCQPKKDTLFLYRAIEDGDYHAIFIDQKNSAHHDDIARGFNIDTNTYNGVMEELKDSGHSIHRFTIDSNQDWYSLHQYNQKTYAYLPSEPFVNTCIRLTDTTVSMNHFNDGFIPAILKNIDWQDARTLKIEAGGLYKEFAIIIFHFLNESRDLAIMEFPLLEKKNRFCLMATPERLKQYPIIVNYAPGHKAQEWEFDKIDFESLLKAAGSEHASH